MSVGKLGWPVRPLPRNEGHIFEVVNGVVTHFVKFSAHFVRLRFSVEGELSQSGRFLVLILTVGL